MVKDESFFEVARSKNAIYVGVRGLGNLGNAPVFNEFAEKMIAEGWSRFVIDLEHCRGVDSTFMGTLLGISRSCTDQAADGAVVLAPRGKRRLQPRRRRHMVQRYHRRIPSLRQLPLCPV